MKWLFFLFLFVLTSTFAGQVGDPFSGAPIQITPTPGSVTIIEAENFDKGGEGVAYHDPHSCSKSTSCSCVQTYRPDGVNVCTADFVQYYISYDDVGMWVEYTIFIVSTGLYTTEVSVAFADAACCGAAAYHVELDGAIVTKTIPLAPLTAGWNTFEWRGKSEWFGMVPGIHRLRIVIDRGWFNWDAIRIKYSAGVEFQWQYIPVWRIYP